MAMPDFQSIMLPILKLSSDGNEHSLSEAVEMIEREFNMTDSEKAELVPSGRQRKIYNRTAWAVTHLKKAGLLSSPRKGQIAITKRGTDVLSQSPEKITMKFLKNFSEYMAFLNPMSEQPINSEDDILLAEKPLEEVVDSLINTANLQLADDLLELIYKNPPAFFEKLVVDLLLKMGYGGFDGAGQVTGQSGDGGIDGIIKQDILGFDSIYIQAKRWDRDSTVGCPEIQKFVGALAGKNATKGIFITSSKYSNGAKKYVENLLNAKVILVDGTELARLMIKYDLGVGVKNSYYIKGVDSDYFEST